MTIDSKLIAKMITDGELIFVLQIALLCLTTFVVLFIARLLIKKRLKKLDNTDDNTINRDESILNGDESILNGDEHYWQKSILSVANLPLSLAIVTVGLTSTAALVARHYSLSALVSIESVRAICIIILTTWFLSRITGKIEPYLATQRKYKIDKASADTIVKLITVTIFLSGFLALLDAIGFSIQTILAFGGLSSVILGLAAKDFIAGLYGTFIIYFDKPFVVGDSIRINIDKVNTTEGVVEKITWRLTQLRALDKKAVFIPNSQFSSILVENATRSSYHKLMLHLDIAYGNQSNHIKDIISKVVQSLHKLDSCISGNDTMVELYALSEARIGVKISLFLYYSPDKPKRLREMKSTVTVAVCSTMNDLGLRFTGKIEG